MLLILRNDRFSQCPLSTSDTVACETPARRARSAWVRLRLFRTARMIAPSRRSSTPGVWLRRLNSHLSAEIPEPPAPIYPHLPGRIAGDRSIASG